MLSKTTSRSVKKKNPESLIKLAICQYLTFKKNCMFWVNSSTGIYDPTKKIFRKNNSAYQRKGVADILGIYRTRPMAIEVKAPNGRISPEQDAFLTEFGLNGGISILARSVDDVINAFKLFDIDINEEEKKDERH